MTDRELKKMLAAAYTLPETAKEKQFIRRYEKRTLQIPDILRTEFRYMGWQSILTGAILCMIFGAVIKMGNPEMIWAVSALIPVAAVIPVLLLSRSERYGMAELEAASRFSLRFLRLVRMFIIGVFTLGLLLMLGVILRFFSVFTRIDYLMAVVIPYLTSVYGAMLIARKRQGKENVLWILAVCLLGGMLPFAMREIRNAGQLSGMVPAAVTAALFTAAVKECILYVKESENVSWNLY